MIGTRLAQDPWPVRPRARARVDERRVRPSPLSSLLVTYRRAVAQKDGTVFIGEDFDDEDPWVWPGRFSAHWEADDGSEFVQGPKGVSLDEAIAWGRSRGDVVLVRPGDSDVYYSAGTSHPTDDSDDLPVWPERATVQRRRHPGMEHLDISADQPLRWMVRLPRQLPAEGFREHARRVADALAAYDAVSEVRIEGGTRPFEAVFRFSVLARSHAEALERVLAVDQRTSDAAPLAVDGVTLREGGAVYVETGWNPYDDIRPADR